MSRFISQAPGATAPVVPGTLVTQSAYTTNGFSAGDYVYLTSTGYERVATVPVGNGGTMIAGIPVINGIVQAPGATYQRGPVAVGGNYAGSTITSGTPVAAPVVDGVNSFSANIKTLLGGNYVILRRNSNTITFTIVNDTNTVVVNTTTVTTNANANTNSAALAARSDGGFTVFFLRNSDGRVAYVGYNASGVQVYSSNFENNPSGSNAGFNACGLSQGGCAFGMRNASGNVVFGVINSAINGGTVVSDFQNPPGNFGVNSGPVLDGLLGTANGGFGGFVIHWYSPNNGRNQYAIRNESGGGLTSGEFSNSGSSQPGVAALTDGGFVGIINGGSLVAQRFTRSSAANVSSVINDGIPVINSNFNCMVGALPNGGFVVSTYDSSGWPTYIRQSNPASTGNYSWSSLTTVISSNVSNVDSYQFSTIGTNGSIFWVYKATGGTAPFTTVPYYTDGITNGQSFTSPPITYPTRVFAGVALTSASAGTTGQIAVNGSVSLSSSYPLLTSNISFDLTSSNSPAANKGFVSGRTVNLKGSE